MWCAFRCPQALFEAAASAAIASQTRHTPNHTTVLAFAVSGGDVPEGAWLAVDIPEGFVKSVAHGTDSAASVQWLATAKEDVPPMLVDTIPATGDDVAAADSSSVVHMDFSEPVGLGMAMWRRPWAVNLDAGVFAMDVAIDTCVGRCGTCRVPLAWQAQHSRTHCPALPRPIAPCVMSRYDLAEDFTQAFQVDAGMGAGFLTNDAWKPVPLADKYGPGYLAAKSPDSMELVNVPHTRDTDLWCVAQLHYRAMS